MSQSGKQQTKRHLSVAIASAVAAFIVVAPFWLLGVSLLLTGLDIVPANTWWDSYPAFIIKSALGVALVIAVARYFYRRPKSRIMITFAGLAGLIFIGITIPKYFISDGMENFNKEQKAVGKYVTTDLLSLSCMDNPILRAFARKIKIIDLEILSEVHLPLDVMSDLKLRAKLQPYSFFGVPMKTLTVIQYIDEGADCGIGTPLRTTST